MLDFFKKLFDWDDFMPHGHCYFWQPEVLWLHVVGDVLTSISYFIIPIGLFIFVRRREDLEFKGIILLFGAFILACGLTHLIDIWTIWIPTYRLEAMMKLITGIISTLTAIALFRNIPVFLKIPGYKRLETANEQLRGEIKKRIEAQEELNHQQELLEKGEKAAQFGTIIFLPETNQVEYSRGIEIILELSSSSIGKENFIENMIRWVHEEDREMVLGSVTNDLKPGNSYGLDYRILINEKRVKWVQSIWKVTDDGKMAVGTIRDITKEKIAEDKLKTINEDLEKLVNERTSALKESESRFRTLADNAPLGVALVDFKGKPFYINRKFEEIVEYSPGELQKMSFVAFTHPEDVGIDQEIYEEVKAGKHEGYKLEKRYITKSGTVVPVNLSVSMVRDEQGNNLHTVAMVEDITRRKQVERKLFETQKELESFIYSVSHDLRAPIRHIEGFTSMAMETDQENISEEGVLYLGKVKTATIRLGTMIDELLDYSRSRNARIGKSRIDLNQMVVGCMEAFILEAKERKIEWKIHRLPHIYADAEMMTKVFDNLFSNAVKFTSQKQEAVIEVGYEEKDNKFVIWIKDNGAGFNMKYKDKLFSVFQRLHKKSQFEGTGIGLANVKRIIQLHDGEIWGEGNQGEGATFYFTIPQNLQNQS